MGCGKVWEEGFSVPRMERGLSMNDTITEGYSRQVKDFYAHVYPSSVSKVFTHASTGGVGGIGRRGRIGWRGEGGLQNTDGAEEEDAQYTQKIFFSLLLFSSR